MPAERLNDCPRCPRVGSEIDEEPEYYQLLSLRFDIRIARSLARDHTPVLTDKSGLQRWLSHVAIDQAHVGHLPARLRPGIMVTLPSGVGMPLIDGNHSAARALRDGTDFYVYILSETETRELLRRSLGAERADEYWRRIADSKPHPADKPQGE